jgi:glucose-6-phosphate isomerase
MVKFDWSNSGISYEEFENKEYQVKNANIILEEKNGPGNDYLGWLDYTSTVDQQEIIKINDVAKKIAQQSDILIVIGIGGSYLGAKSVISALTSNFYNELPNGIRNTPKIYFAGHNISSVYLSELITLVQDQDFSINVISKSGTTTEPSIAFRIFKQLLEKKYGKKESKNRIYATTDAIKGALRHLSDEEGYESFIIPDNIGGRYSVLTPVGLLPIACSGIDIKELIEGAAIGFQKFSNNKLFDNPAHQYAVTRNIMYEKGKTIEILVNYDPQLLNISEWWKQLYGESDGKNNKGLFPVSANFSTDLHSLGQIIQEGRRNIFETVIDVENSSCEITVPYDENNLDQLNYLSGLSISKINKKALQGTLYAHVDGGVPNNIITLSHLTPLSIGELIYFFEKACAINGYMLGINPFNQPGVEAYKKNMFALLNKPGYEELTKKLLNRTSKE